MSYSLQSLLLVAFGALFALLFLLISLIKTFTGREKIRFWDTFLAYAAVILVVVGLVFNSLAQADATPLTTPAAFAVAGVLAVLSLLIALLETRRPQKLRGSRGVMGLWAGVLIALAAVGMPLLAERMLPAPTVEVTNDAAEATGEVRATAAATVTPMPTNTVIPTETLMPTVAPTRTPRPTLTPRPTRTPYQFSLPTDEPTATVIVACTAVSGVNVRLRAEPNTESKTLLVIPFGNRYDVLGRNEDSSWWYVRFERSVGWVSREFVQPGDACGDIPVQSS